MFNLGFLYKKETDFITIKVLSKIIEGITNTVKAGIRVSANTLLQHNKNTIYDSESYLRSFAVFCQVIPPAYDRG